MENRLPLFIDPMRSAQQRLDFVGIFPAEKMERLITLVSSVNSDVSCRVSCFYDEQKLVVMQIDADVSVNLLCQRCFKPFPMDIHVANKFSPVKSDAQIVTLPEHYEPAMLNEYGEVNLLMLVEDEIMLTLPLAAMHESKDCDVSEDDYVFGDLPPESEKKPNPFAILASLKKEKE